MKRLTAFAIAILMLASLSLPAFAVNPNQDPMLTDTEGIAAFPMGNDSSDRTNIRQEVVQNPMLVDTAGIAAFSTRNQNFDENYGIAPAWEGREGDSKGMTTESYRAYELPGVFDNTD